MDRMKVKREEHAAHLKKAKEILDSVERRHLDKMSIDDEREYNEALAKSDALKMEIDADDKRVRALIEAKMAGRSGTGERLIDRATGREIRVFDPGDSLAEYFRRDHDTSEGDLSAGRALRAILTGDWSGAELEQRAMATTPGADGGYLVPAALSAEWFDMARNLNVCLLAGARIVEMTTKTLSLAAIAEDPAAYWKIENEAAEGETVLLREILLTSKTLYVGPIVISMELAQDAPNCPEILNAAMAGALAGALDRAGLLGDSESVGPAGLINDQYIQTLPTVGAIENYSDFSAAYAMLQQANANMPAVSVVYNPSVAGTLDALTADDSGQPLLPPPSFASIQKKLVTNQIGNDLGEGDDETVAIMGDFKQMLIGSRLTMSIDTSNSVGDTFERYQVAFRAVVRGDVALSRPSHFVTMSGITPGYVS